MSNTLERSLSDSQIYGASQAAIAASLAAIKNSMVIKASSIGELQSYDENYAGRQVSLVLNGYSYTCIYLAGDQKALVAGDPNKDSYIPPASYPDGSMGTWFKLPVTTPTVIGLFVEATAKNIPTGVNVVRTSGHYLQDRGAQTYVADATITTAFQTEHPLSKGWSFVSKNGRGFRLSEEDHITFEGFGANGNLNVDARINESENINTHSVAEILEKGFDNYPIWLKARDFLDWCGRNRQGNASYMSVPNLYFGRYQYRFSNYIDLDNGTYGFFGYGPFTQDFGGSSTMFTFDPGIKAGIVVNTYNSSGLDKTIANARIRPYVPGKPDARCQSGAGSLITDIHVKCLGGVYGEGTGILIRGGCIVERCFSSHWGRDGIGIVADVNVAGNANCTTIRDCVARFNGRYGLYTRGGDVNACSIFNFNGSQNGACGIYEDSFLGNTYYGGHTDGNGALPSAGPFWKGTTYFRVYCNLNGHFYRVSHPDNEAAASTTSPSGTTESNAIWKYAGDGAARDADAPTWTSGKKWYFTAASYIGGLNNRTGFYGIYQEGNQQNCTNNAQRSPVWTGGYSFWEGSGPISGAEANFIIIPRFATSPFTEEGFTATDTEYSLGFHRHVRNGDDQIIRYGYLDVFQIGIVTGRYTTRKYGRANPVPAATQFRKLMLGNNFGFGRQLGLIEYLSDLNGEEVAENDFFFCMDAGESNSTLIGYKVSTGGVGGSTAVFKRMTSA